MVSRSYMAPDSPRPSPTKVGFDQNVLPALIDAAGGVEAVLERLAIRARRAPALALAAAFGIGTVFSLMLLRRR